MDNISIRNLNEDTAASMYLSFDAESTMSSACYKTLEAMSDTSNLFDALNDSAGENQINRTLEVDINSQNGSPLETVKKKNEISVVKANTPLRVIPKNILKEYKDLCSTPSKEQLLKAVDVTRGSDTTRCADLGFAFSDIDDENPAFFSPPNLDIAENNKENILPDIEEVSTLSTCSVETTTSIIEKKMCSMTTIENKENVVPDTKEVFALSTCSSAETPNSVIEKKMSSMSTVSSISETEFVEDMKITDNVDTKITHDDDNKLAENPRANNCGYENQIEEIAINMGGVEITPKSNNEIYAAKKHLEVKNENNSAAEGLEIKEKAKSQIATLNRKSRLSVCEPNLQTGKPSRILSSNNKRQSLLPTSKNPTTNINAEIEIPLLINRMLKIADNNKNTVEKIESKGKDKQISGDLLPVDKRRSFVSKLETRTSHLAPVLGNKRPFNFTTRMSVVVKTTLNSPARKIARKSVLQSMQRRSVMPQAFTSSESSRLQKVESQRKSMVPKLTDFKINTQPKLNKLASVQATTGTKPSNANSQRKSIYPIDKDQISQKKPDISFTCNVCKDKFRIKSLLDAHKRSHESDTTPPAFVRKPSLLKQSSSGALFKKTQNQCKYCDKKFALTKALHIHLLQNCPKIPPSEKRKLQYTDLNHVEKAQLPNVFPSNNMQSSALNIGSATNENFGYAINKNKNISTKSSSESLNEKKDRVTWDLKATANGNSTTASQTTNQKVKKISAHSGVYRTPSKAVPCHLCKLTFKSILDYTNHNLASHGSSKIGAVSDTAKDKKAMPEFS